MAHFYVTANYEMNTKTTQAAKTAATVCMKIICLFILIWLITFSVKAGALNYYTNPVEKFNLTQGMDTAFKKTDPNLIYTTRDYYFDLTQSTFGNIAIKDFTMLLTFNIGVTMKDEIKQIGFKEADMDFALKQGSSNYAIQEFTKYEHSFIQKENKIVITFYPDKTKTATSSKTSSSSVNIIEKCTFNGVVKKQGVTGLFTFYFSSGSAFEIQFNPGIK
ncbi:MAG: hypothetical protein H7Y00_14950 [Fimbriimonadaceae bacterium]|nr:hypothetical protein [Chitinophagales bacterium]